MMRAMAATAFGGPEVLQMQDVPEPEPGPGDVLIEVDHAAVNPVDCKIRSGAMPGERSFPLILGYDVSGEVTAVGSEVERFRVGQSVFASPSLVRPGSNGEYVAVDERTAARKADEISHEEAASLPLVTITAWEALHHHARLHSRETVLIEGGAGGVGHVAIQLACLHNTRVIATAGREESAAFCRQCGADEVINYREEDVCQRVRELTEGRGCDVVFDCVGGAVFTRSIDNVAVHGRLVTILPPPADAPIGKLFPRAAQVCMEFMGATTMFNTCPQRQGEILATVGELAEAGRLRPHIAHRFALQDLQAAHEQQETGHTMGKIVVNVKG